MHPVVLLMRLLAPWPLGALRAMGWVLGHVLFALARSRRRIVRVNLALCFAHLTPRQRWHMARRHFVGVAQSLLDRSWLWHGSPAQLRRRLQLQGDLSPLLGSEPVVMLAPHFVGLDAGGSALTQLHGVHMASIYVRQRNAALDEWVRQGRNRSGHVKLYFRHEGVSKSCRVWRDRATSCISCLTWILVAKSRSLCRFTGCRRPRCHRCRVLRVWAAPG